MFLGGRVPLLLLRLSDKFLNLISQRLVRPFDLGRRYYWQRSRFSDSIVFLIRMHQKACRFKLPDWSPCHQAMKYGWRIAEKHLDFLRPPESMEMPVLHQAWLFLDSEMNWRSNSKIKSEIKSRSLENSPIESLLYLLSVTMAKGRRYYRLRVSLTFLVFSNRSIIIKLFKEGYKT